MAEDETEIKERMRFDRGYISLYFTTSVKSQDVRFEKPLVLLSEKKCATPGHPSFSRCCCRPLFIFAEDVDSEAPAACILNELHGQLQVCAVKHLASAIPREYPR